MPRHQSGGLSAPLSLRSVAASQLPPSTCQADWSHVTPTPPYKRLSPSSISLSHREAPGRARGHTQQVLDVEPRQTPNPALSHDSTRRKLQGTPESRSWALVHPRRGPAWVSSTGRAPECSHLPSGCPRSLEPGDLYLRRRRRPAAAGSPRSTSRRPPRPCRGTAVCRARHLQSGRT